MLETTPEQHPMLQPMYKIEIHPPGTKFPAGGVATTTLTYENDDGGPSYSKDSLTFTSPADGDYLVRVADVRGLGGDDFGYHLVLRACTRRIVSNWEPRTRTSPAGEPRWWR